MFSLMHFLIETPGWPRFFYRFFFGVLAGLLFLRGKSLWLIVGLHTGWNFIALSVGDSDWRNGTILNLVGLTPELELLLNSFVLALASLVFVRKRCENTCV